MDYDSILKVWSKREQELVAEMLTLRTAYAELHLEGADEEILDQAQIDMSYLQDRLDKIRDAISVLLSTHEESVLL